MNTRTLHPGGTMPELARQMGSGNAMFPPTVCAALARFMTAAEMPLKTAERESLWDLCAALRGTDDPGATHRRLRFLASRALRRYAARSLSAAGPAAAAAVLRDEPDDAFCAAHAERIADRMRTLLPDRPRSEQDRRLILAERATRTAALAARRTLDADWTTQLASVQPAADAMTAWCQLVGSSQCAEIRETIAAVLAEDDAAGTEDNTVPGTDTKSHRSARRRPRT